MICPRCYERHDDGPACSCGLTNGVFVPPTAATHDMTPHSRMNAAQAIHEARRLGDPSEGDGWRRLLFRMAQLLEDAN